MADGGEIFLHDIGGTSRDTKMMITYDLEREGAIPEAVAAAIREYELLELFLDGLGQTSEPDLNLDLFLHQQFPDLFPDPLVRFVA